MKLLKYSLSHYFLVGCLCLSVLILISSCKKSAVQNISQRKWELVWSDDFLGNAGAAPDPSKWTFDIGNGTNGWGNQELEYYTDRSQNISLDGNGNLVITAIPESYAGFGFTSARIKTQGLFSQAYGRFEARIKTPYGPGIWPAFWLLGNNVDTVGWPECGEVDIMEQRGQKPYINNGSVHGPGYSGGNAVTKAYALSNGRFDTDYHIYAVEWGPDFIDYFVDNFLYQRITPNDVSGKWVFNHPFFMILNLAVGGNYVGFPTTGTVFPQYMYVDYVKVYKQL
ncbi:MAG TPA: glycoside hydrolase family 16 protein [Chitinophagaceae bacterium]|nr:glycoside hydrolase family 16 protein [Chitinophagaceae bacterium]